MARQFELGNGTMTNRTWNLKLMATEEQPETTVGGISGANAAKIMRALVYGSEAQARAQLDAAAREARGHAPLAA
jgi:hypothetical protein